MCSRNIFLVISVMLSLSLSAICDAAVLPPITKSNLQPNTDAILKCRQKCFSKILNESTFNVNLVQFLRCKITPNCYMCWDYCRAVSMAQVDLAHSMCSDKKFCTKGCKIACDFHRIKTIYEIIKDISKDP